MKTERIDQLNIGLLAASLFLAYQLPYELFLVAYAVLGPLHYLTEINWLREKHYFSDEKNWMGVMLFLVALIVVPKFFYQPWLSSTMEIQGVRPLIDFLMTWSNGFIFMGVWLVIVLRYFKRPILRLLASLSGLVLAYFLNSISLYTLIIGLLLPTVIHVYVFTLLFMLYGALKSNSKWGFLAFGMALLCPVLIIFSDPDQQSYILSQQTKSIFLSNNFHVVNTLFAKFLGLSEGKTFFFYEKLELKIQIFMAFAYTYHYLNWFSKTSLIGWHKTFTIRKTYFVATVWLCLVALFWYDYKAGFLAALFLSFLHVLLELPLNWLTLRETSKYVIRRTGFKR